MKSFWRALGILKLGFLAFSALASFRLGSPYPLAIFAVGFLAVNAAGLAWGLRAGERAGIERGRAVWRTLLIGSSWWASILSEHREEAPDGKTPPNAKTPPRDDSPRGAGPSRRR